MARKDQADMILERAALQLRQLLEETAAQLRPFPPFPGAFFTNAIEVEAEAAEIGARYGEILVQRKTPLSEAIEAFLFFRRSLDQTAKQLADRHRMTPAAAVDAREQIAKLADRVLQGLTTAFEAGRS